MFTKGLFLLVKHALRQHFEIAYYVKQMTDRSILLNQVAQVQSSNANWPSRS